MSAPLIGKPIREIFSRFTTEGLLWLVSNESGDFGIAFRHDGELYRKQPTRLFKGDAIKAAIATMWDVQPGRPQLTFYPASQQGFTEKSCWGGFKLSPTPADEPFIAGHVRRIFNCLRAYGYGRSVIVEACGDGSWQFWAIRNGFSAHATWWRLLRKVSSDAGVGGEIFPSKNGIGMPAPGSSDPHTGRLSHIVFADLTAIFREPVYSAFDNAAAPLSAPSPAVTPNAKY
jgi:hypothetical protein